ncbi:MAG TPA: 16S rRNA (guanine(966)-N(2))-methyltransferase RsmD [Alphaproteobacteria bacterium]|nr:16S rRNA (guanine(966)-N(2))-methyltransferase RsmD [Rhodospirillaceae bacterium]HRJ12467.1 16S rRNA (guanine(966)-N(2))-methyltransferase RsmD [Alphaproteobacteria bacterium]
MITIRSGIFKNKRLQTPETDVRPTSDKIRQAIFNVLMHAEFAPSLIDAKILDAFAGTGAMGLEAISRGAAHGWFLEKNPAVKKILQENLKITDCATLLNTDALQPPQAPEEMDLIFLDPPYGQDLITPALTALLNMGWIGHNTLLVIESDADENIQLPDLFQIINTRSYGRTAIRFAGLA